MSDKSEMWRAMRAEAKRMLRHTSPLHWSVISDRLYARFGHETDEDMILGPELDQGTIRRDGDRYYEIMEGE